MSAVFGAASVGCIAAIIILLLDNTSQKPTRTHKMNIFVSALSASLIFAFTPAMWSNSVIAETHTLTVFYILLMSYLLLRWLQHPSHKMLLVLIITFGFGLSINYRIALLFPCLVLTMAYANWRWMLSIITATMITLLFLFSTLYTHTHYSICYLYVVASYLLICAIALRFTITRSIALYSFLLILGLTPFLYFPWAASHNPPVSTGYAKTWEGFIHLLGRGQYEKITCVNILQWDPYYSHLLPLLRQIMTEQFMLPILIVGCMPFIICLRSSKLYLKQLTIVMLGFLMYGPVTLIGMPMHGDRQTIFQAALIFIPAYAFWSILIGLGIGIILTHIDRKNDTDYWNLFMV